MYAVIKHWSDGGLEILCAFSTEDEATAYKRTEEAASKDWSSLYHIVRWEVIS